MYSEYDFLSSFKFWLGPAHHQCFYKTFSNKFDVLDFQILEFNVAWWDVSNLRYTYNTLLYSTYYRHKHTILAICNTHILGFFDHKVSPKASASSINYSWDFDDVLTDSLWQTLQPEGAYDLKSFGLGKA